MDERVHELRVQRDDYLKAITDLQQKLDASGQIAPLCHDPHDKPLKIKKPRIK
jgi:hypothetical protein